MSELRILGVDEAGFCFGVRRALQLAKEATEKHPEVACLGPLIHNRQVVEDLERRGMRVVEDISEVRSHSAALVRAHGAGPTVYQAARDAQVELIDATCPFVRRVQQAAAQFAEEDYQVLVLGERDHPEAQAIVAHAGGRATIIESAAELEQIGITKRVAVVCQTTQRIDTLQELVSTLLPCVSELRVANTICDATSKRQKASVALAQQVDLMIVIGGYHSANTNRLAQICRATGTRTEHIETAAELRGEWLDEVEVVGITAGASTPPQAVEDVRTRLLELAGERVEDPSAPAT
ncbi:MAG: 4-hydroxy-3-methylbut-2-enyl diphosphate reductase [candidate division WS1 bacterium]|jgi:small subunit ribosomal protein S1|nr:4-hydroxy-3-methylbut-2-enyl diphosphate reductase [candidate division WS1 bacterium]